MNEKINSLLKYTSGLAVALVTVISLIRCYFFTSPFTSSVILSSASLAITIAVILMGIYIKILWKFNPLEKTPLLEKDYDGTLVSSYDNKKRAVKLLIEQNLLNIKISLQTEESYSKSLTASFRLDEIEPELCFVYINKPQSTVRERSPIHYGTTILRLNKQGELEGDYFTDRQTSGTLKLKPVKK